MMTNKIWDAINDFGMLKGVKSLVLGVSGGIDSVSMLHFFVKNWNGKIIVAHVNHNLRGNESRRDEDFVKKICNIFKVDFQLASFDILNLSKKLKKGIEETSREKRYEFFQKVAEKNVSMIATAHTLSDNLETMIFNLSRGSGLSGLSGIPPRRGKIIRPLIYATRQEIEEYAIENDLKYVTDSSNLSNLYSRNKIRNIIIPQLKTINSKFESNAGRCLNQIRCENEYLDLVSREKLNETGLNCAKIKSLPEAIKNRVLKLILEQFIDIIEYRHVHLTSKLINGQINSFNISGDKRLFVKNGFIYCDHMQYNMSENSFYIVKVSKEKINEEIENHENLFNLKRDISFFKFRTRKEGDCFHLSKRNCTKSLRKLFNELKVPVELRSKLKILEDVFSNEIVWIESVGVSKEYEINDSSLEIGKIVISEN